MLHNQRALLVMDNAASGEQIAPLLPPTGCALIVTSRFRFTVPGLFVKDLGTLPEADARKLLLTIAPRIGGAAVRIAELCGYLPLALRLAASALAVEINLKPSEYARRLAAAGERLNLIDASLTLSYDLLDEEKQSRWRLLGVFPASFDEAAAAAVWEVDEETARVGLGDLLRDSMLDVDEHRGRAEVGSENGGWG